MGSEMTSASTIDDPGVPRAVVKIGAWTDVDFPDDTYRTISGQRRGIRGNYVEAYAMQEPSGSLVELSVRAELDVWEHTFQHRWDDELSAADAREWAARLAAAAAELSELASAFNDAADEIDGWVA